MTDLTKVKILGKDTIHISHGLLRNHVAYDLIQNVKSDQTADAKFALITDTNIAPLFLDQFVQSFEDALKQVPAGAGKNTLLTHLIPPGETSKSRETVGAIHDWLASNKCMRDTIVIALGGGVVGDMIGYAAATYMRGVPFIQIPTTLLAMVDSSIGGKTAIDTPHGKNLVGAFWQPQRVYIDLAFLQTLPKREVINGMAEVIKTAVIRDANEFATLEQNADAVAAWLASDRSKPTPDSVALILKRIVHGSARIKAEVVSADEKEGGLRNILNFGHSIGHAMEAILAPQILHGECVSIGMVKEAELSRFLGALDAGAVARLTKCLSSYGLPVSLEDKVVRKRSANRKCPVDDLISIMAVDKKNAGGKKRICLLSDIGKTFEDKATAVADQDIRVILAPAVLLQPHAAVPDHVSCTPPGSKSISNRALVLAALGSGKVRITNLLHSDDTQVMLSALAELGAASFTWEEKGRVLVVDGRGGDLKASEKELYLGNAGTASRFLTTVVALASPSTAKSTILTGNARMKERPIEPLVDALQSNGIAVQYREKHGSLPVNVAALGGFPGGEVNLAATLSSQYVSSLLMCAPYAKSPVTLRLVGGKPISQGYIDMTIAMMADFGVQVQRSKTQPNTYHIPQQGYRNPASYEVESDASSATYPLAIAAITGKTCTIPNIGSASLQGDAKFATDVLGPMGCSVKQSEHSTTVTGPAPGALRPLPEIDMEPMTDAFLTATVLAAVAQPTKTGAITKITGIANQRVKECDRINAMATQLKKFGVSCKECVDGIEVHGRGLEIQGPAQSIYCYDDHRVAMSFAVLSLASPDPVIIEEKDCTAKTWPAFWDALSREFKVSIDGVEPKIPQVNGASQSSHSQDKSIFLIGMRGAGKTTAGRWAGRVLDRPFVDLDEELEQVTGEKIDYFVRTHGWEAFRAKENEVLLKAMREKPDGYIFATGGGVVETPANREALISWKRQGGMVLLISRSISNIIAYLQQDKTRPAWVDDMQSVWLRRKPWYQECSNYQYYGTNLDAYDSRVALETVEREKFSEFVQLTTGRIPGVIESMKKRDRSFFVAITMPHFDRETLPILRKSVIGSDAVELRVDLLVDPNAQVEGVPTLDFIIKQLSFLRAAVSAPILFTIRTRSQGGRFPDQAIEEARELYRTAIRMACELVDLEMSWPDDLLQELTENKCASRIVASHHSWQGMSWSDGSWMPYYNRALQYGDVIKLVGMARTQLDNDELEGFRRWAIRTNPSTPMIAINMGQTGRLSRIRNAFLTPVSHPALPFKAAPGQLSVREICQALTLIGDILPKDFYLFGKPISHSRSPALQNTLFDAAGLPHQYRLHETDQVQDLKQLIRAPDFGGASVTIPLKQDVPDLLDELDPTAQMLGAVNTIVPVPHPHSGAIRLVGYNTDWLGVAIALKNADCPPALGDAAALVIGSGGTSRAAIHALHSMEFSPIYLVGRTPANVHAIAASFPAHYPLRILASHADAAAVPAPPIAAVGTIPGDRPIDPAIEELLQDLFARAPAPRPRGPARDQVLLEMAYKPVVTPLMALARRFGWRGVPGLEPLTGQGVAQFELWMGRKAEFEVARRAVMGG